MNIMKSLILVVAAVFFLIPASNAKEINYCNTFWFDAQAFEFPPILKASEKSDCRERPIPLILKNGKIKSDLMMEVKQSAPFIPDYLILNLEGRSGNVDMEKFFNTINKTKEYKENGLQNFSFNPFVEFESQADGFLVFSEVSILDSDGNARYLVANYLFFKKDRLTVFYSSKILDVKNILTMRFLVNLKSVFRTMRVGW